MNNPAITSMLSGLGFLGLFKNIPLIDRKRLIKSCENVRDFEIKFGDQLKLNHNKLDIKIKRTLSKIIEKSELKQDKKRISFSNFLTTFQMFYPVVEALSKKERHNHPEFCEFADIFLYKLSSLFEDSQLIVNSLLLKLEVASSKLSDFKTTYYLTDHPKFSPFYPIMYINRYSQEEQTIYINKEPRTVFKLNYGFAGKINFPVINGDCLDIPSAYKFPVYISTHAIQRMKERLFVQDNNLYDHSVFMSTFENLKLFPEKNMIQFHNGKTIFGYFTYELNYAPQMIVLKTFLTPLMSKTPESDNIYKRFGISNDEVRHFGLDSYEFMLNKNTLEDDKVKFVLDNSGVNIHNLAYKNSYNISDFRNYLDKTSSQRIGHDTKNKSISKGI